MLKGDIQLSLLIGPVIPRPVSRAVIEAMTSLTVRNTAGGADGFQMSFAFDNNADLNSILLLSGGLGPLVRTIIAVTVKGANHVLIDGVITNHQLNTDATTGQSTLTITGSDLTTLLDQIDFSGIPYPAMPPEARVALIIAKYAPFAILPLIIPSIMIDVPIPTREIPVQRGTDLAYIRGLAAQVGYVFYIDSGPVMFTNYAYWGPEIKVGPAQKALNVNMDAYTNVKSLSFSFDGRFKTLPVVLIQNELTGFPIPIPIPNVGPLNPPLGAIQPPPGKYYLMRDTAGLSPLKAVIKGLAKAAQSADAVTASGSLDVVRYGAVLKARSLVGVRGAGEAFNGLYFVKSVNHTIEKGKYSQSFSLSRNGMVSTVPSVPI